MVLYPFLISPILFFKVRITSGFFKKNTDVTINADRALLSGECFTDKSQHIIQEKGFCNIPGVCDYVSTGELFLIRMGGKKDNRYIGYLPYFPGSLDTVDITIECDIHQDKIRD